MTDVRASYNRRAFIIHVRSSCVLFGRLAFFYASLPRSIAGGSNYAIKPCRTQVDRAMDVRRPQSTHDDRTMHTDHRTFSLQPSVLRVVRPAYAHRRIIVRTSYVFPAFSVYKTQRTQVDRKAKKHRVIFFLLASFH